MLNFFWLALLRRPVISAALSLAMIVILILVSRLKYDIIWMTANFLDLMIINADTISFLLAVKPDLHRQVLLALALLIPALALLWWIDSLRVRPRTAVMGFLACLSALIGTGLGLVAGYYEGWWDRVIMRLCDVLFAFPGILLAIGIVAILGGGMANVIIAVSIFSIPTFARLVRGNTLSLKHLTFIEAARSIGASDWTIVIRHIFPGTIAAVVVYFSLRIGTSIITAASLSFIGMGAQPPTPEWGAMLNEARADMMTSPHVAIFPSLAIFLTVLAFNLLGDGLRDALDPKIDQK